MTDISQETGALTLLVAGSWLPLLVAVGGCLGPPLTFALVGGGHFGPPPPVVFRG